MYITVQLYLSLFLIFYPLSCHMYTLLYFLILVTIHVMTYYSCTRILCILCTLIHVYPADTLLYNHNIVVWLFCILHIYMFILSRHHYATATIRLNKKYKVIKTCYMLLIYTDVIRNT